MSLMQQFLDSKTALRILGEWFGDGAKPVPLEQAQARSDVCTGRLNGKRCPHNDRGQYRFNMRAAMLIRWMLSWRKSNNRMVQGEADLNTCSVCNCVIRLKVDVPFPAIYRNTADPTFA